MVRLTPLWLAQPSRFAALSRRQAQAGWVAVVLLVVLCLTTPAALDSPNDVLLYHGIVEAVRHGEPYYDATAAALRAAGYPLGPFLAFRLPTLAQVQAALPSAAVVISLYLLAFAVFFAWALRLVPAFTRRPPVVAALVLLAGGMTAFVQPQLAPVHEIWAGQFVALSLALRRPGRWVEAAALGLVAMLIRETAVLYVIVMGVAAWLDRDRREALGWAATVAVLAVVLGCHAYAVGRVVGPLDPATAVWTGPLGLGYVVTTLRLSTVLLPVWPSVAGLLIAVSLVGWAGWRDPLAARALATFAAYALLLSLFGRSDTPYWGLMIAPTCLIGLAFAPDAIRDLVMRTRDRRRITVTRSLA